MKKLEFSDISSEDAADLVLDDSKIRRLVERLDNKDLSHEAFANEVVSLLENARERIIECRTEMTSEEFPEDAA